MVAVVVWQDGAARAEPPEGHPLGARGLNLNFANAATARGRPCAGDAVYSQALETRLSRYGEASVRASTRNDIRALRNSGVSWIRSLVWFAPNAKPRFSFALADARLAAENVANYGADLAAAGVKHWVLAFGPQGRASPSCRTGKQFGECYDASTQRASIDFILTVRSHLDRLPHPTLWVDLSNEACPGLAFANNAQSVDNTRDYLVALLRAYRQQFPADRLSVSCIGDGQLDRRLRNISAIFRTAGAQMRFADAHIYARGGDTVAMVAKTFGTWERKTGISVLVGETNIGRPDVEGKLAQGFAAAGTRPLSLIHWPLKDSERVCGADHAERL